MIILATFFLIGSCSGELHEVGSWRLLTFAPPAGYPGASPYGYSVYAPMAVFTGLEVSKDRLFLSMPRFFPGQPATFGWVPKPAVGSRLALDLPITPFPNWDWHRSATNATTTNCTGLISVYRSREDHCGRLWVLDTGNMHSLSPPNAQACLPKLIVFNSTTGTVIRWIEFPWSVLTATSLLVNLVLDSRAKPGSSCDNMFIYIADSTAPAIIVYDVQRDQAWRLSAPQMYPSSDHGYFKIAGDTFFLMDGITGMALSKSFPVREYSARSGYTDRTLYFQALSSDRIYAINTSELLAGSQNGAALRTVLLGSKPSQGAPLAYDQQNKTLIFSSVSETWVVNWAIEKNVASLLAYNTNLLQFVSDLVVDQQQLWAISNRFQQFFNRNINTTDVNLRILRIDRT